ncbi:MAG: PhoPQ-activated protein PqaA family protein [Kosmotogaceae bacterium]
MKNKTLVLIILLITGIMFSASMEDYVSVEGLPKTLDEANYSLKIRGETANSAYEVFTFEPFEWKNIQWENHLLIILPEEVESKTALVFITGDYTFDRDFLSIFNSIAVKNKACVAVLFDIPNQPLFGNLKEDWLIAYTFDKFLETRDFTWPMLLPMVRATIASMNMVQSYVSNIKHDVEYFILSGASKRGWTTWLTSAFDNRVKAIAPIAYDNLNIKDQMNHQLEFWGSYSKSIDEYVSSGILSDLEDKDRIDLLEFVDPFSYIDRIDIPKLIIVGTNDPYWPVDAVKLYYDKLKGTKGIVYAPNKGHGAETHRIVNAINALFITVEENKSLPLAKATYEITDNSLVIKTEIIENSWELKEKRVFHAYSNIQDFRNAFFHSKAFESDEIKLEINNYTAFYVECEFSYNGTSFTICTPVDIVY